jgi:hypothetical protein
MPKWFRDLYTKHGEEFSYKVRDSKILRITLKPLFELFALGGRCGI